MSRVIEVVTPEQVAIRYELAGFGSRCLAMMIDYVLQLVIFLILLLGFYTYMLLSGGLAANGDFWEQMSQSIVVGIGILVLFLVSWGYYIAFETLWNGATPGKRVMGLRVVKDGGHPVDFRAVLIRNLLRAVDALPGVPLAPIYGFGFVAVLANNQYKRLGDMAAGTLVVRHGREDEQRRQVGFGATEVYRLLDATVLSQLSRLTRDEYRMVQRFLERRDKLAQPLCVEFARRLAQPLMEKFAYQIPAGIDYERWLDELNLAYRTHAFSMATPAQPPASVAPPTNIDPVAEPEESRRW